ncbi:MAG: HpcH/HpaI aldolase family protein [Ilumatobacteraceae bacterium]
MSELREIWQTDEAAIGVWLSDPSTVAAEVTARQGFDYCCVDTQHGAVDYQVALGMLQAIELGGGTPITRVPWNEQGIIGKMLDAGAHGVIVPMVNTREQAEAVVRSCRYAPDGSRSFGPTVVGMRHSDYVEWAGRSIAVIPMIETTEALGNLDDIMSVPGVDAIYVGPADLSLSLGLKPRSNDGEALFDEALAAIVAACRRHGVVPGVHASGALAGRRIEQGFRMITVASDLMSLRSGLVTELELARKADVDGTDASSPY